MDSSLKQLFLSLLALLVLSSLCTTTNGADRFFFSKMLRAEPPKNPTNLPPKSQSGHGYGLYSRPEQFEPIENTQNIPSNLPYEKQKSMNENYENEFNKKQLEIENKNKSPSEFSNEFTEWRYGSNNDKAPTLMNKNYANEFNKKQLEIESTDNKSPSAFSNEFTEERYESNDNNYDQKRRDWQYQHKYGMSDTRFMDNGRYYYNVNSKRYGYPFELNPKRTNSEEFGLNGEGRKGRDGNEAYGYGNENEYNNGVNEYIP